MYAISGHNMYNISISYVFSEFYATISGN